MNSEEENIRKSLEDQKFEQMTTTPVGRLISKLAVPSVLSMMVTAFYNLADAGFISHIGEKSTQAVAAVGVIFSYQAVCNAAGFFFGHGSGNYISRALGRKEREKASEMAATGVISSFAVGTFLAVLGCIFSDPILRLIGANDLIMPEAQAYFRFIAISTPFLTTQLTLNNQLRLMGNARLGMIGIMSGALLNIVLDALLIFGFELGVTGASIATAVSQLVGCSVLLAMTHVGDGIPPRFRNFRPTLRNYREILAGGLPSLSRQGLNAVATVVLNRYAVQYGADPLAAISIVSRLIHMILCIAIGVGQGFQPVCGFNYGAKLYKRVQQAYFFGIRLNTIILCAGFILLNLFTEQIISAFGSSAESAVIACRAARYYSLALPFLGFVVMTEMIHQNTRQTAQATVLAAMRQGIALIPCVVVMDAVWGLEGVLWAQPAANLIALAFAVPYACRMLKKVIPA